MSLDINDKPQWSLIEPSDVIDDTFEVQVFDSVISEFNDIAGFPIDYYVLETGKTEDKLYGEDPMAKFSMPNRSKVLYEPTEENNILNIFGFSSDDTIQYAQMSKSIFSRDISDSFKPKIGDVIHTLWNNNKYEIVDIGGEQKIFKAHKMVWEFILKPYRFGYENNNTQDIFTAISDEMPEVNDIFDESFAAKTYSDNALVDTKSDQLSDDIDTTFYGYID